MFNLSGMAKYWKFVSLLICSDREVEFSQYDFGHAGDFHSWNPGGTVRGGR